MNSLLKKSIVATSTIISAVFTFVPEGMFEKWPANNQEILKCLGWFTGHTKEASIIINRLIVLVITFILSMIVIAIRLHTKRKVIINGDNYAIEVKYGDILKQKHCKKVINFDECYTTNVGQAPGDIKSTSICGQFLAVHPDLDIASLIAKTGICPKQEVSSYNGKACYEPGTLISYGDYLLMAFAKLEADGRGRLSRDEYLSCLNMLWKEIDKYYGQEDVSIPILGAGITRFDGGSGASIPQQELLNMIIGSYKLSSCKIKKPYKLRIICKHMDGFSINHIS